LRQHFADQAVTLAQQLAQKGTSEPVIQAQLAKLRKAQQEETDALKQSFKDADDINSKWSTGWSTAF
jgi:hypothetical protein